VPPSYREGDLPMIHNGEVRVGGLEPPGGMQSHRVWACCVYQASPRARGAVDAIQTLAPNRVRYLAAPLPELVLRLWWWREDSNLQLHFRAAVLRTATA
jgi:hypothetical protein